MADPPLLVPPPALKAAQRIGALLRRERQARRLSQQALADRLDMHQAALARWELGRRSPTLAQVDEVLGFMGLRLRLDVEPIPSPSVAWDREQLRLAALTPAQRLLEYPNDLANLVAKAQREGVSGAVDGQTAAWLQGVPGQPRWLEIATTRDEVHSWVTLKWTVQGAVDINREQLRLTKAEITEQFIREGNGLLKSIYGLISVRVVDELPETARLCLRETGELGDRVDADVIRLEALAAHWQTQPP